MFLQINQKSDFKNIDLPLKSPYNLVSHAHLGEKIFHLQLNTIQPIHPEQAYLSIQPEAEQANSTLTAFLFSLK